MKCKKCNNKMIQGKKTFTYDYMKYEITIINIPALICKKCKTVFIERNVHKNIFKLSRLAKKRRFHKINYKIIDDDFVDMLLFFSSF